MTNAAQSICRFLNKLCCCCSRKGEITTTAVELKIDHNCNPTCVCCSNTEMLKMLDYSIHANDPIQPGLNRVTPLPELRISQPDLREMEINLSTDSYKTAVDELSPFLDIPPVPSPLDPFSIVQVQELLIFSIIVVSIPPIIYFVYLFAQKQKVRRRKAHKSI